MGRKNAITPYAVIQNGDMSADIIGKVSDLMHLDNVAYHVKWAGTAPVGEIKIQITNDDASENSHVTPVWTDLDFGTPIPVGGNAGDHLININQIPARWIRPVYVFTSGTGSLDMTITSKMLGG